MLFNSYLYQLWDAATLCTCSIGSYAKFYHSTATSVVMLRRGEGGLHLPL